MTKKEYEEKMKEINELIDNDPEADSEDGRRLQQLANEVGEYEKQHYPILPEDIWNALTYDQKLAAAKIVFGKLTEHMRNGGTYRYLIYNRLGFNRDAYSELYSEGMEISNMCNDYHEKENTKEGAQMYEKMLETCELLWIAPPTTDLLLDRLWHLCPQGYRLDWHAYYQVDIYQSYTQHVVTHEFRDHRMALLEAIMMMEKGLWWDEEKQQWVEWCRQELTQGS